MTRLEQKQRAENIATMFRRGASAAEIATAFSVTRPSVYNALRRTGALPPYGKRPSRRVVKLAAAAPIVKRDPCSRCGTRADIGCVHSRGHQALGLAIAGCAADRARRADA